MTFLNSEASLYWKCLYLTSAWIGRWSVIPILHHHRVVIPAVAVVAVAPRPAVGVVVHLVARHLARVFTGVLLNHTWSLSRFHFHNNKRWFTWETRETRSSEIIIFLVKISTSSHKIFYRDFPLKYFTITSLNFWLSSAILWLFFLASDQSILKICSLCSQYWLRCPNAHGNYPTLATCFTTLTTMATTVTIMSLVEGERQVDSNSAMTTCK